ncbi:MAG: mannose-1-phosphate guanylyltransferase [Bdellovibrionales bacterium]|nr:mannose-1-phosphate guanylyltransferase [Bdellovibrionales bacterium]
MDSLHIVILAGGHGSRFWPVSRQKYPKQFLSISENGESLIHRTAERSLPLCGTERLWVVTNVLHRELVHVHVPQAQVLCEPIGRNTAASVGFAAIHILKSCEDAVMIVLPADHAVRDEALLRNLWKQAAELANKRGSLVTFGIEPTFPHTGYGYIRAGNELAERCYQVSQFCEKPDYDRALAYLRDGHYFWNSGMFAWRADVYLEALKKHMPDLYDGLAQISAAIGSDQEEVVTGQVFDGLQSQSVDFGVLEKADNCDLIVTPDFGWNDVGSWDAWAQHFPADRDDNVLHGDTLLIDSKGCVVTADKRLIALVGVQDLIVIDSGDALLICQRERAQEVKEIVDQLKQKGRKELL